MRNLISNIFLLSLVVALPAFARVRAVATPNAAILYSATVVDAVTAHPVVGAQVANGGLTTTTNNSGAFTIPVYAGLETTLIVSRTGYDTAQAKLVVQPGLPGVPIKLQPRPTVTVHTKSGQTAQLDADSFLFIYVQPLLTQFTSPTARFCANGNEIDVDRSQISRIIGPAVSSAGGACCNLTVLWFDVELKSGDRQHVSLVFDCYTYDCYIGGRDHDTYQLSYFSFADISEVDFP
jgi:hypothetical protein